MLFGLKNFIYNLKNNLTSLKLTLQYFKGFNVINFLTIFLIIHKYYLCDKNALIIINFYKK